MVIFSLLFFIYWIIDVILIFATRKSGGIRYALEMAVDCASYIGCYYWGKATGTLQRATIAQVVIVLAAHSVIKALIKRFSKK